MIAISILPSPMEEGTMAQGKLERSAGLRVYGSDEGHRAAALPVPGQTGAYQLFLSFDGKNYAEAITGSGNTFTAAGQSVLASGLFSGSFELMLDPTADTFPYGSGQMKLLPNETVTQYEPLPPVVVKSSMGCVSETTHRAYVSVLDARTSSWLLYQFDELPTGSNPVEGTKLNVGQITHPYRELCVETLVIDDGVSLLLTKESGGTYGRDSLRSLEMYKYSISFSADGAVMSQK